MRIISSWKTGHLSSINQELDWWIPSCKHSLLKCRLVRMRTTRMEKAKFIVCLHPSECIFVYYWRLEHHIYLPSLSAGYTRALVSQYRQNTVTASLQWSWRFSYSIILPPEESSTVHTNAFSHWDDAICIQGQNTLEGRWQLAHLSVVRLR